MKQSIGVPHRWATISFAKYIFSEKFVEFPEWVSETKQFIKLKKYNVRIFSTPYCHPQPTNVKRIDRVLKIIHPKL